MQVKTLKEWWKCCWIDKRFYFAEHFVRRLYDFYERYIHCVVFEKIFRCVWNSKLISRNSIVRDCNKQLNYIHFNWEHCQPKLWNWIQIINALQLRNFTWEAQPVCILRESSWNEWICPYALSRGDSRKQQTLCTEVQTYCKVPDARGASIVFDFLFIWNFDIIRHGDEWITLRIIYYTKIVNL